MQILGRIRADRVLCQPVPTRAPGTTGRPPEHGPVFRLADPATWSAPTAVTTTHTSRYGTATATAWDRLHPKLTHRSAWIDHTGTLPVMEGTLIQLRVEHLPGDREPKPIWLWTAATDLTPAQIDQLWQAYLRRFDLEHTFRLLKQTLGWTTPRLREPAAAGTWTWLVLVAYTQLRLARTLTGDLRRPWERLARPGRLSPARVRRGFRNLHPKTSHPAGAPKPSRPGPGRPPGTPNRHPAPRHDVGKTVLRAQTLKEHRKRAS